MKTKKAPINGEFYNNLLNHCKKQYVDIVTITTAYVVNKQVYAIDYVSTTGIISIASGTFDADFVINFK